MKNLTYEDDKTTHGGVILNGSDRIKVKGRRAARRGDLVSCPVHGENRILGGTTRITDCGVPLAQDGDSTECGSVLIASSTGATVR